MDQDTLITFLVLVFGTVFLLTQVIIVPTFGTNRQQGRRIRKRLGELSQRDADDVSLVRQNFLKKLSRTERWVEQVAPLTPLRILIEQSGRMIPISRVILTCAVLGGFAGIVCWILLHHWIAAVASGLFAGWLPILRLSRDRRIRLEKFEEQLPEALDLMVRALRTGYPFKDAMAQIANSMEDPIAGEFALTFEEINYGKDVSSAFNYFLMRVPSVSLAAMTAAILIQRETGGNLAEVLKKISGILRGRFKFHRKIKTLSAEGRLSAWILALAPYVMFVGLLMIDKNYFDPLFTSPTGRWVIGFGLFLFVAGTLWVRKIVTIDV
jgi:tight adherence protein B